MRSKSLNRLVLFAAALLTAPGLAFAGDGVPKPDVVIANPGTQCVAPPDVMRRKHMDMLTHQRDLTLRQGVRGAKVSLNGCIECHASKTDHSVLGSDQNFCQTCHSYMAVKLDCFECHQPKTGMAKAGAVKP